MRRSLSSIVGVVASLVVGCHRDSPPSEQGAAAPRAGEGGKTEEPSAGRQADDAGADTTSPQPSVEQSPPSCVIAKDTSWFLHISDVHLDDCNDQSAGDTTLLRWKMTVEALRARLSGDHPPSFILFTGDVPQHGAKQRGADIFNVLTKTTCGDETFDGIAELAGTIPVLYLPGNNDSLDGDYATFTSSAGTPLEVGGWQDAPALHVASWTWGSQLHGYYRATPVPGLTVLAMNTVMFSAHYPAEGSQESCTGLSEPRELSVQDCQLAWLEQELASLPADGKALIAMHIPPGVDAFSTARSPDGSNCEAGVCFTWHADEAWLATFLATVRTHAAKIVGLSYGHTHMDEVRLLYGSASGGQATALGLSAPAISPLFGNQSGFKGITYGTDFELTDAVTWYAQGDAFADDRCYRYASAELFDCKGQGLEACLAGMPLDDLNERMAKFYEVGKPGVAAATKAGIEVRPRSE